MTVRCRITHNSQGDVSADIEVLHTPCDNCHSNLLLSYDCRSNNAQRRYHNIMASFVNDTRITHRSNVLTKTTDKDSHWAFITQANPKTAGAPIIHTRTRQQ
jgi:hypothetical protein